MQYSLNRMPSYSFFLAARFRQSRKFAFCTFVKLNSSYYSTGIYANNNNQFKGIVVSRSTGPRTSDTSSGAKNLSTVAAIAVDDQKKTLCILQSLECDLGSFGATSFCSFLLQLLKLRALDHKAECAVVRVSA